MKSKVKDSFIMGFAIFSIIFGAGNILFSTYIGALSGSKWIISLLFFLLSDLGLVTLSVVALAKTNNDEDLIYGKIGKMPSKILDVIMLACMGPLIAIPRSAATSFSMFSFKSMLVFSLVYFTLVFIFSYKSTKVVDLVGKYLTPILLISILLFIFVGVFKNENVLVNKLSTIDSVNLGLQMGYQTLDILCVSSLSCMIFKYMKTKKYNKKEQKVLNIYSFSIAIFLLIIIYTGLSFIGAKYGNFNFNENNLLLTISKKILNNGSIFLSIITFLACFTTAVGLTSSVANKYSHLTFVKYEYWVIIICVVSMILSNIGLNNIVNFASPILNVIYPLIIILTLLSFFNIKNTNVHKFSCASCLIVKIICLVYKFFGIPVFVSKLPLYNLNLEWVIFAIAFAIIGSLFKPKIGVCNEL